MAIYVFVKPLLQIEFYYIHCADPINFQQQRPSFSITILDLITIHT